MRTVTTIQQTWVLVGLVVLALVPSVAGQVMYEATVLGEVGGGDSEAYAISDYTQAVGRWQSISAVQGVQEVSTHVFHWQNGEMLDLNAELRWGARQLELAYGVAFGVSNTDHVVGAAQCPGMLPPDQVDTDGAGGSYVYAFVFRPAVLSDLGTPYPGEAVTFLGTLPGGARSVATAINRVSAADDLQSQLFIVGWSDIDPNGRIHGFIVTPSTGVWASTDVDCDNPTNPLLQDLGTLGADDDNSSATAVNDAGHVVGWSYSQRSGYAAFLIENPADGNADGALDQWFADANGDGANDLMVDLGTLGGHNSWARDINNDDLIVGESDAGDWMTEAFLWHPDMRAMQALGTLGGRASSASAVNSSGQVVGWSLDAEGVKRAFIISPQDSDGDGVPDRWFLDENGDGANDLMSDLNDLLPSGFRVRLEEARDINDRGEIVGWGSVGTDPSAQRLAYLLSPSSVTADGPHTGGTRQDAVLEPVGVEPDTGGSDGQTGDQGGGGTTETAAFGPFHFLCGVGLIQMLPLLLAGLCGVKLGLRRRPT